MEIKVNLLFQKFVLTLSRSFLAQIKILDYWGKAVRTVIYLFTEIKAVRVSTLLTC